MNAQTGINSKYAFPLVSALVVGVLLLWSWQQWISVTTDAGHNLYTFWKLSEGERLYRELSYYHGPLSPWVESWFFRIFGVSILTLALTSAVVVWVIANIIYGLFRHVFDHSVALAASFFFLFVFAFSQYVNVENYNFLIPYKFEAVHGILFGLLSFACGQRALAGGERRFFFLMGLCLGCSLLTATEVVFANFAAISAFFILSYRRLSGQKASLAWVACGLILPCLLAWAVLATYLPAAEAVMRALNAVVVPIKGSKIAQNPFYLNSMGLIDWRNNLMIQARAVLVAGLCACLLALIDRWARRIPPAQSLGAGILLSAVIVGAALLLPPIKAFFWAAPEILPFVCLVSITASAWKWLKRGNLAPLPDREILGAVWAVWSIALLAKIILFPRFFHYGFYLAMPAALLLIGLASHVLPEKLKGMWAGGAFFRTVCFGLAFTTAAVCFEKSQNIYAKKTFRVGYGNDTIATVHPEIMPLQGVNWLALDWAAKNIPPYATLLTLPEGSIFNYLTRRARPGPYTMNVVEMLAEGEGKILDTWMRNPPDFIALVQNESGEFGLPPFGTSEAYGKATMDWVKINYVKVKLIGLPPFQSPSMWDYGVLFLKRR